MASLADLLAYSQNLAKKYTSLDTPQDQTLGETLGDVALGFAPVVGTAQGARDFERARRENDYLGMGLSAASMLPVVGGVVKAGRTATKASKIAKALEKSESEISNLEQFTQAAKSGKLNQAKETKQELDDLLKGKTKYAELPRNTDEGDIYDLMDKGYQARFIHGPNFWAVGDPDSVLRAEATFENPSWYSYGKLYGYPEKDIAHFYQMRNKQQLKSDSEAFQQFLEDKNKHIELFKDWE